MQELIQAIKKNQYYGQISNGVTQGVKAQMVVGMPNSLKAVVAASLHQDNQRTICLVAATQQQATAFFEDVREVIGQGVLFYPGHDFFMVDYLQETKNEVVRRGQVLKALLEDEASIVVTSMQALISPVAPAKILKKYIQKLAVGQTIEREQFLHWLTEAGYERVATTTELGQFSVRGGIIDIYPVELESPVRLVFFGDELEEIRVFDAQTQRTADNLTEVNLAPATEWPVSQQQLIEFGDKLLAEFQAYQATASPEELGRLRAELLPDIEKLRNGIKADSFRRFVSLLYGQSNGLINYLTENSLLMLDEPSRMFEKLEQTELEFRAWVEGLVASGTILPTMAPSYSGKDIINNKLCKILMPLFTRKIKQLKIDSVLSFNARAAQEFYGQVELLKQELVRWKKSNYTVIVLVHNKQRKSRLERTLKEQDIAANLLIEYGSLQAGFELPESLLVVLTEKELFGEQQRKVRTCAQKTNVQKLDSYKDIAAGDYVVHYQHGIGQYVGLETLEINNVKQDYLRIQYANNDALFVPIDQMQLIQKYVAGEEQPPRIYSLGTSDWQRATSKAKSAVKDIAEELIKLYAQRQAGAGYAFAPDSEWQREFEAMFPYEETPDQLRAIAEIKKDMESPVPMDRLLCGDVGYGKTEVALRAAFKAVLDGKQVAILVPTTILAQQHYENCKIRFAGYPVNIEVLSRFRTRKEITASLEALKSGGADVIIGTHRLLSKDVEFADLGLLVVDEEQRFGVTHKEKIKKIKLNVDVLTLTATPIPRTLHMSLLGVRDLSLIETPPANRFPVETFVLEHNFLMIKEVIEREIGRGGQVYYVHNRVLGLERIARELALMLPDLRICIGHGQMKEQQLEKVMLEFIDREYDVLISTTIIESGLDIPNVNTLIVQDADKMGLSQLYQLRGRVGRSNRIAYAYFTYQRNKVLTEIADKRLQAISDCTELGSGFKLAMRDLAIRGAGNLLGAEQHGHIAAIGFEMYNHLLSEAVLELKGTQTTSVEQELEPTIELQVEALFTDDYIADSAQKIALYKRLARVKDLEEVWSIEDEVLDRFGELPQAAQNLMAIARIRAYCYKYKIKEIEQLNNKIEIRYDERETNNINGQVLFEKASRFIQRIELRYDTMVTVIIDIKKLNQIQTLELLEKWLYSYQGVQKEGVL